jgi:hypothetical protein
MPVPKTSSDQDLLALARQTTARGTVIWTAPTGDTYITTPGSALLFPSLCAPTGKPPVADVPVDHCGDRGALMPRRQRTRAQNRAQRIAAKRRQNRQARLARRAQMVSYFAEPHPPATTTSRHPSDAVDGSSGQ